MRLEDDASRLTRAGRPVTNVSCVTTTASPILLRRLTPHQLLAFDAVLALAVGLLCWYAASESPLPPEAGWHEPVWVSMIAGVVLAGPAAVRRRWPVAAAAVTIAAAAVSLASGVVPDYAGAAPIVALGLVLYTVGADIPGRRSVEIIGVGAALVAGAFAYAAHQAHAVDGEDPSSGALVIFSALVLCACWAIGRTVRERRSQAARSAEQATARAVGEERLRIAREMHDIVAHSMSLIAVKATIADHVADESPQEMREALRIIASTSRDALGELRRTLGALRTEAAFAPMPGLADFPALIEATQSAGLVVDLDLHGGTGLPDGVGLAVFRVVQEALTNVVKHAGATRCRVTVEIGQDEVEIEVADNGREHAAPNGGRTFALAGSTAGMTGQGLIGMRERVALFDGEFAAGRVGDSGWTVAATLRYAR
jgi:signal transduction histidine kinase